jgi:Ca2+-transporting ATPase
MPLPIRPLQILFLNLVTDVFPALALGVGEGDPHIMQRDPRDPDEPIMTRYHWMLMGGYGMVITASVLGALALALTWLNLETDRAVTVSFLTLATAQLWHVFNMRDRGSDFFNNGVVKNLYVWGAVALCVGLLLLAVYLPFLANLLSLVRLSVKEWALTLGMAFIPLVIGQLLKELELI